MSGVLAQVPPGPVVVPLAVVGAAAGLVLLIRGTGVTGRRLLTVVASVGYAAAVLSLTLFPLQIATGDHANRVSWIDKANLIPVLTIDLRTFVLNIALFVPLGVLLPLWRRSAVSWVHAARWGLMVSAVIEGAQWATDVFLSSGRTCDVNDLIANTAGAVLGFVAAHLLVRAAVQPEIVEAWAVTPALHDNAVLV